MNNSNHFTLLVKDNPGDIFLMRGALNNSVMPIYFNGFLSNKDDLCYIFEQEALYRTILLVNKSPVINGFEVFDTMVKKPGLSGLPKVVKSAPSNQIAIDKSYDNGANYFSVKPIKCSELEKTENGIVLKWRKPSPYNTK